jgi:hypothetical protein
MCFPAQLFTIKRNLVFMNHLYQKVAVAYVGIALGFTLGATKEVKAATFTLQFTTIATVTDVDIPGFFTYDGLGDGVGLISVDGSNVTSVLKGPSGEVAHLNEFNIGSFSFTPDTVITKAVLQVNILTFSSIGVGIETPINPGSLGIFGYVGNGTVEASDFEAGVFLSSVDVSSSSDNDILNFDVTPFVNQRVNNQDAFAGFGIRALNLGGLALNNNDSDIPNNFVPLGLKPRLILETAEPVPEPTTIFGSALALTLGGWLKRKKSNPQNKATSQH